MANETPEWEVFVRESPDEAMRHVGSVSARTGEEARERATALFGRFVADVWLCPVDAVAREREVATP
jgi:rSAM-partnered protein